MTGEPPKMTLADFLTRYRPGSSDDRTWDEEEADILARVCLCCGQPGHYQLQLEAHLLAAGATVVEGICVSPDGRSWDGHHRITAARRLGIEWVTFESPEENAERWVRDHGHVDWHGRTRGDCADVADLNRHWKVTHA